jgi:hypothetical protein
MKDLWLVGSRATAAIENDPRISQFDVAGIAWLNQFPAKNADLEVFRFFLVPCGEEVRGEEGSMCNRRVGEIQEVPPVVDKLGCAPESAAV